MKPFSSTSKPLLRWVGGKTWSLPLLHSLTEKNCYNNYFEPFFGGGAFYFSFNQKNKSFLSDINKDLIVTYNVIKNEPKKITLNQMEDIFGDVWDLEITSIKKSCQIRAEDEKERIYKTEGVRKVIKWTDMFNILDYHSMLSSNWTKEGSETGLTFQKLFSLNTEEYIFHKGKEVFELGSNSNKKSIDWLKKINNYRNSIAHSGSKSYGLIKKEVKFIEDILNSIKEQIDSKIID